MEILVLYAQAENEVELLFVTGADTYFSAPVKLKFLIPFVVTQLREPTKVPLYPFPVKSVQVVPEPE